MEPREPTKALTRRSLFVALVMVLIWTVGCCFMVASGGVRTQHLLMVIGADLQILNLQGAKSFMLSREHVLARKQNREAEVTMDVGT